MNTARARLEGINAVDEAGDVDAWARLADLAAEMDESGRDRASPVREVFALLGDRWSMLILLALGAASWRYATLKRIIGALAIEGGISQRMLTLKLRALERNGFVVRAVSNDVPPRVSYGLSDTGASLLAEARSLLAWVKGQAGPIAEARRAFDARRESGDDPREVLEPTDEP